jgi:alkylated DNA repair dioxygenase AlkB
VQRMTLDESISTLREPTVIAEVPGLLYWPRFISPDGEQMLISALLNSSAWVGVTSSEKSRRVIHYGYKYDYSRTSALTKTDEIPERFAILPAASGLPTAKFDQLIINEYLPGQGISSHIDDVHQFGDVIFCISLGSGIMMTFSHPDGQVVQQYVAAGSAYAMTGDARYVWRHAIDAKKYDIIASMKFLRKTRYSLTYRATKKK